MSFARTLAALTTGSLAACASAAPPAADAPAAPASAAYTPPTPFARLSSMVGTWRPADAPDSTLRIHFSLTAGGTVLMESWERAGKPHSLTLYHADGIRLLATHYCPQGNQPRLALASGYSGGPLHFAFRDATDLDPAESHQHDLWFDFSDPKHPVRGEVYRAAGGLQPRENLRLVRADAP
jgi:hypothetical protein